MRKFKSMIVAVIMCLTAITGVYAEGFSDVKGHWGESYINDVVSKGLAKGYEGGTFLPDNPTTRIEAVIFASNMYSDSTINSVYESSKSKWLPKLRSNKIPSWADKYMVFGLEKGIYPETFLKHFVDQNNPNKQNYCLRYEFITFMVNALGFKNEFSSNPKLSFADVGSINPQVIPYIDVMIKKGIIVGTGKFNPNDRLTRAQVAVVLSNSYKYSEKGGSGNKTETPGQSNEVSGKVLSMTMSNTKATIQLQADSGAIGIYTAEDGKVTVVNEKSSAKLSDIKIGQKIKFIANGNVITKITIDSAPTVQKSTVSGEVASYSGLELTMLVNGNSKTYGVNPSLELAKGTKKVKVIDLKAGDKITVDVEGETIVSGSIATINKVINGIITSVDDDIISVKETTGTFDYEISSDAEISIDKIVVKSHSELSEGDIILANVVNSEIAMIEATTIQRTIKDVIVTGISQSTSGTVFTFRDNDSNVFSKTANKDTAYIVKGKEKTISDIALAYECNIIVKGSRLVTLETQGDFKLVKLTGDVEKVDIKNKNLKIKDSNGDEYLINVDYDTIITNFTSSENKTIKSIFEGDKIVVEGAYDNSSIKAKKIIFWK
ncbi:MAG: S-layer homology domain-containing protein [Filifactoraceae bacterium]